MWSLSLVTGTHIPEPVGSLQCYSVSGMLMRCLGAGSPRQGGTGHWKVPGRIRRVRQTSLESEEAGGTEGWSAEHVRKPPRAPKSRLGRAAVDRTWGTVPREDGEPHSSSIPYLLHPLSYLCLGHTPYNTKLHVFPVLCVLSQQVIQSTETLPGAAPQKVGTVMGLSPEPQDLTRCPWRQGGRIFPR